MNITKKALALVGVALLGSGAFAGNATITLDRVQQRYPWNGMVDIDYTVTDVANPADYYVRFTADAKVDGEDKTYILHDFLDAHTLIDASNGTWRVTWTTGTDNAKFFATNVSFKAELVFAPGDKSKMPYPFYMVIDLAKGTAATAEDKYPVTYEYFASLAEATNKYNAAKSEYRTTKLVMRKIPAGSFVMGSPADEVGRESQTWMNKETQHPVTLTHDFYFGIYPVTQKQYQLVMGTNPSQFQTDAETVGEYEVNSRPVEKVSYQMVRGTTAQKGCNVDALMDVQGVAGLVDETSFLGLLRTRTGLETLDLPTDAQWEYASRANTQMSTYFANNVTTAADNALRNQYLWDSSNAQSKSHGVGQKIPNAWGLYDTLGNVCEWCRDRVTAASATTKDDWGSDAVTDPIRQVANGNVTGRGGDWYFDFITSRCACRHGSPGVSFTGSNFGFRLSMTLP